MSWKDYKRKELQGSSDLYQEQFHGRHGLSEEGEIGEEAPASLPSPTGASREDREGIGSVPNSTNTHNVSSSIPRRSSWQSGPSKTSHEARYSRFDQNYSDSRQQRTYRQPIPRGRFEVHSGSENFHRRGSSSSLNTIESFRSNRSRGGRHASHSALVTTNDELPARRPVDPRFRAPNNAATLQDPRQKQDNVSTIEHSHDPTQRSVPNSASMRNNTGNDEVIASTHQNSSDVVTQHQPKPSSVETLSSHHTTMESSQSQRPSFHRRDPRAKLHQQRPLPILDANASNTSASSAERGESFLRPATHLRSNSASTWENQSLTFQKRSEQVSSGSVILHGDDRPNGAARLVNDSFDYPDRYAHLRSQKIDRTNRLPELNGPVHHRRISHPASPSCHTKDEIGDGTHSFNSTIGMVSSSQQEETCSGSFSGSSKSYSISRHEEENNRTSPNSSGAQSVRPRKSSELFSNRFPIAQSRSSKMMSSDCQPIPRRTSSSTAGTMNYSLHSGLTSNEPKVPGIEPLLTTLLGEHGVVARAEQAVEQLLNLLHPKRFLENDLICKVRKADHSLQLPSKQHIMKAMTILDGNIKSVTVQHEACEKALKIEENSKARHHQAEVDKLQEEQTEEAMCILQEQVKLREQDHHQKLAAWDKHKEKIFGEDQKLCKGKVLKMVQGVQDSCSESFSVVVKDQMKSASDNISKSLARLSCEFEKTKQSISKSLAEVEVLRSEYDSSTRNNTGKKELSDNVFHTKNHPNNSDLVKGILAENQCRAKEGHTLCNALGLGCESKLAGAEAEKHLALEQKSYLSRPEWTQQVKLVTGLAKALYHEPTENPFFHKNANRHNQIAMLTKEYIRDKKRKLNKLWTQAAEEYEYRKRKYKKHLLLKRRRGKGSGSTRASSLSVSRQSILGGTLPTSSALAVVSNVTSSNIAPGRTSSNPYRRARRGNEVRSEYEQEQIIADLAAKEAMEKRITSGGCVPTKQILPLEHRIGASYINTLKAQRVDPLELDGQLRIANAWSDMEKCIFLDRFLQFPKDFRKISSFLRNKTTKDCVRFYYDSKQYVPYKAALKEHVGRRKRRGDYCVWDATIQAALSVGAVVTAGSSVQKPLFFRLPESDISLRTKDFHPPESSLFQSVSIRKIERISNTGVERGAKEKAKNRMPGSLWKIGPLFKLAKDETKFFRPKTKASSPSEECEQQVQEWRGVDDDRFSSSPSSKRQTLQKWTNVEKKVFIKTLEEHGCNWPLLASMVGTKSISQVEQYYYDFFMKQTDRFDGDQVFNDEGNSIPECKSSRGAKTTEGSCHEQEKPGQHQEIARHQVQGGLGHIHSENQETEEKLLTSIQLRAREGQQLRLLEQQQLNQAMAARQQHHNDRQQQLQLVMDRQSNHFPQQRQILLDHMQQQHADPSNAEPLDTIASGNSDPTALWVQAQQRFLASQYGQQQAVQMAMPEEETQRLLRDHQRIHQQQILTNLLPWLHASTAQQHQVLNNDAASHQLHALLSLRQQHTESFYGSNLVASPEVLPPVGQLHPVGVGVDGRISSLPSNLQSHLQSPDNLPLNVDMTITDNLLDLEEQSRSSDVDSNRQNTAT